MSSIPRPRPAPSTIRPAPSAPVTGAQSLVRSLEAVGAEVVFGIPGGAIFPAYDLPYDSTAVRPVLVRHEQGAGYAAAGYAQATGRVGVCMAASGSGATNLVTAIANAHLDSVPLVAITGQVPSAAIGTDACQEADICGITMPITKHNFLVTSAADIPRVIAEAFHLAGTGRPGPVLVDLPKDVLQGATTFSWPPTLDLPGYRPVLRPHSKQIREAARLMAAAHRPVLYVGGGVLKARATAELRVLAEVTGIPVVTTLMARGAFPDSHPQCLGMTGMHGTVTAVAALQHSDLILALGARFDDRVTGRLATFAPAAAVVHADIDPAEISKNRVADVPIVGDCREVIAELIVAIREEPATPDRTQWWARLNDYRDTFPLGYEWPADGSLAPQYVMQRLGVIAGPEAVYVAGVGRHQMWAAQFVRCEQPSTWLTSGGLGARGYAVPAAIGAKLGRPEATVWAVDGDGCFQMTSQELATCAIEGIPIKVAVINNGRQRPDRSYRQRRIPDFVLLAEAMGCVGLRCDTREEVDATIDQAMQIEDRPVVVDFIVDEDAQVRPMVPAGTSNDDILAARDMRPDFDAGV